MRTANPALSRSFSLGGLRRGPGSRGRAGIGVALALLGLTLASPAAAQITWYFRGALTAVDDVHGNAADDAAFAAGFYALGTEVDGWVTLDPAQASSDYDRDDPLNESGPNDPQLGFYLGAVADFSFRIRSRVELDDAFTFRSTLATPFLRAGSVLLSNDIDFNPTPGVVMGDQYTIFFPSLVDEVVFMPPMDVTYLDRNGWEPVPGGRDTVYANLTVNEFTFQSQPQLLESDALEADLTRGPSPGFFNVTLAQGATGMHELNLTFTLSDLAPTPVPEPSLASALALASFGLALTARAGRGARRRVRP